jgi:hypothetical protein
MLCLLLPYQYFITDARASPGTLDSGKKFSADRSLCESASDFCRVDHLTVAICSAPASLSQPNGSNRGSAQHSASSSTPLRRDRRSCHMLSRSGWHIEDGPLPTAWWCSVVGCCTLSDMVVVVATMALARSCCRSIDCANGCCLPGSAEPSRGHDLWSRFGTTDLQEPSK